MTNFQNFHTPVLLQEAIEGLKIKPGKKYIDATLGGGGHGFEILRLGGDVLGVDCDQEAIEHIERKWKKENGSWKGRLTLVKGNFRDLKEIAIKNGFSKVSGILFDLGVSTHQLLTEERGFSFNTDSPLDMRMDPELTVLAADLVNGLNEGELYELFTKLGEEHNAWAIARALVRQRSLRPVKTCRELAAIVASAQRNRNNRINPATRVFQALRIAVNDELNNLRIALPQAVELLEKNGRLVVISFHSLEDRIVKNFFKEEEEKGVLEILTKKPWVASPAEVLENQKSRSAKMRIAKKI